MTKLKIAALFLSVELGIVSAVLAQEPEQAGVGEGEESEAAAVDYFHDELAPDGQWVTREGYGEVWVPSVDVGWRPYTVGHWDSTDQGFAWVSDEPWGWAVYHYGRWYYDQDLGWAWLPGSMWAPAWVAWQSGGGYLGWAPLPPTVGFVAGGHLGVEVTVGISPGFYMFVRERDFLSPRVAGVIVPSVRNVTIVKNTTNITSYTVVNGRVINAGVKVEQVQKATGRPVPRVEITSLSGASGQKGAFFQPTVLQSGALSPRAEFGKALQTQIAAQQRSRTVEISRSASPHDSSVGASSNPHFTGSSHSSQSRSVYASDSKEKRLVDQGSVRQVEASQSTRSSPSDSARRGTSSTSSQSGRSQTTGGNHTQPPSKQPPRPKPSAPRPAPTPRH